MSEELLRRVSAVHWYHSIDLGDGVRTKGEFDTDAALAKIPFPASLAGKRCLDVGTRDGFWAFAMERAGADEVVGIDIDHPLDLDNPWMPSAERERLAAVEPDNEVKGFTVAHAALDSKVKRRTVSVYDLHPDDVGTFDFAYVGTILLHLRDPIGALTALRRVVTGALLVNEAVTPSGWPFGPRAAAARLQDFPGPFWWVPNAAALSRYVRAAGFRIVDGPTGYTMPIDSRKRSIRYRNRGSVTRLEWLRNRARGGVPHAWILAEPDAR